MPNWAIVWLVLLTIGVLNAPRNNEEKIAELESKMEELESKIDELEEPITFESEDDQGCG